MERRDNEQFLYDWYRENGTVYQFVFRCSHTITNIQYRELVDLIRIHLSGEYERIQVQFRTKLQMMALVKEFLEEFPSGVDTACCPNAAIESLYRDYERQLKYTVIVESYHTSCMVWIPNNLSVDLGKVCSESGYIYTCGKNIYHQPINQADYDEMASMLFRFLENVPDKVRLLVYDEKDFSFKKKGYEDDYKNNGLSDLQIESERSYLKNISVGDAVNNIRKNLQVHNKVISGNDDSAARIVWLFKDYDIIRNGERESQIYYNLIWQIWVNENPCYFFDTDHPAWNNTLIPHTFTGAMVNIARAGVIHADQEEIKVLDPLVGSGTFCLESVKHKNITFFGTDISELTERMIKDNLLFFSMDYQSIKMFTAFLHLYLKTIYPDKYRLTLDLMQEKKKRELTDMDKLLIKAFKLKILVQIVGNMQICEIHILEACTQVYEKNFCLLEEKICDRIYGECKKAQEPIREDEEEKIHFLVRFLLYQYRKAYLRRYESDIYQRNFDFKSAMYKDLKEMLFRTVSFMHRKFSAEESMIVCREKNAHPENEMLYFKGKYSMSCMPDYSSVLPLFSVKCKLKGRMDISKSLKDYQERGLKFDIIMTDPPYGFNTEESREELYHVYNEFINESVKCLNNGGQIMICLLSKTHQGKSVHGFTQKKFVVRKFREAAWKNNMYMVECDERFRELGEDYEFPFYWESKRVLCREVIRLQFFNQK